jgi:DNA-binding XRE family transcriptional regulator
MPRTPKDPNNPITKLRRQLSTANQPLTRQMFAERYGFSAETLKALETGRYKLTNGVAMKIGVAVGVDISSLLKNQDPLLDWNGQPVTPNTKPALRELNLNANSRLDYLINAGFNAARKHPKGDRSALFVLLFDYWLADTMIELDVPREFWAELWGTGDYSEHATGDLFPLGGDDDASLQKEWRYIERPKEVDIAAYGFHELVARGLARRAMLNAEGKRLLLEYLTPAEIAEYDEPINWKLVDHSRDPKFGAPERIAYRRFAKAKGIDPDDQAAVKNAFLDEAYRRFAEKEEKWRQGKD